MTVLFSELFDFDLPARINFVGGGGKTSLILALLSEIAPRHTAVYTTTTRIHPPRPVPGMALIAADDLQLLRTMLQRAARDNAGTIDKWVVTKNSASPDLLRGLPADFVATLDRKLLPVILNEADGSRSVSLKLPREDEPVLMEGAGYLVPVIGVDCLYRPVSRETLFRFEALGARFGVNEGDVITPELAASLLLHPAGVCKGWTKEMRLVPFLNKVDAEEIDAAARQLAHACLRNPNFPVRQVVWGSLQTGRGGRIADAGGT